MADAFVRALAAAQQTEGCGRFIRPQCTTVGGCFDGHVPLPTSDVIG